MKFKQIEDICELETRIADEIDQVIFPKLLAKYRHKVSMKDPLMKIITDYYDGTCMSDDELGTLDPQATLMQRINWICHFDNLQMFKVLTVIEKYKPIYQLAMIHYEGHLE